MNEKSFLLLNAMEIIMNDFKDKYMNILIRNSTKTLPNHLTVCSEGIWRQR